MHETRRPTCAAGFDGERESFGRGGSGPAHRSASAHWSVCLSRAPCSSASVVSVCVCVGVSKRIRFIAAPRCVCEMRARALSCRSVGRRSGAHRAPHTAPTRMHAGTHVRSPQRRPRAAQVRASSGTTKKSTPTTTAEAADSGQRRYAACEWRFGTGIVCPANARTDARSFACSFSAWVRGGIAEY